MAAACEQQAAVRPGISVGRRIKSEAGVPAIPLKMAKQAAPDPRGRGLGLLDGFECPTRQPPSLIPHPHAGT